jgi:hypothetical protein
MFKKLTFDNRNFYIILTFLPFVSVILPLGFFHESNWSVLGLWLIAGACLILNKKPIQVGILPISFFALSILSLIGIFQNGLTSVIGINEIREGTATFLSLAIILATVRPKQNYPLWLGPVIYGVITIFGFYGWRHLGWKTYVFLDIAAFAMLASIPMYVAFRNSVDTSHKGLWDGLYVASFLYLIYYSDNDAAVIACVCAAVFVFLLPLVKRHIKLLPKNDGFYIISGLSTIALLVLFSWNFFSYLPSQLQSRTLLGIVTVLQYFDNFSFIKFMHVLFGYGWGSFQEFPLLNLFSIENFSIYDSGGYKPNWEFLERNLLHTHNFILETMVSSGLVGVGVLLTFIYKWIQNIDSADWSGRFFVVSYLILLSAWFQTPPVLVFCLLAMILVKERVTYKFNLPHLASLVVGGTLIFFACTEFWVSCRLGKYMFNDIKKFESDVSEFINDPAHTYDKIGTYKGSNIIIGQAILAIRETKNISPEIEKGTENLVKDYLDSYQKRNVVSSVHIINLCNTLVNADNTSINTNSIIFKLFKAVLLEHLSRFPERADMTIGYLNFCFNKLQNNAELEFMIDAVLKVCPKHPVGLWFKGLAQLSNGVEKQEALTNMRNAVKGGLLRFMPVETEVLKGLGIQQ